MGFEYTNRAFIFCVSSEIIGVFSQFLKLTQNQKSFFLYSALVRPVLGSPIQEGHGAPGASPAEGYEDD